MVSVNHEDEPEAQQPPELLEFQEPRHPRIPCIFLPAFASIFLMKIDTYPFPLLFAIGSMHKTLQNLSTVLNAQMGDEQNIAFENGTTTIASKTMYLVCNLINHCLISAYPRDPETNTLKFIGPEERQPLNFNRYTIDNVKIDNEIQNVRQHINNRILSEEVTKAWAALNICVTTLEDVLCNNLDIAEPHIFDDIKTTIHDDMQVLVSIMMVNAINPQQPIDFNIDENELISFANTKSCFNIDVTEEVEALYGV